MPVEDGRDKVVGELVSRETESKNEEVLTWRWSSVGIENFYIQSLAVTGRIRKVTRNLVCRRVTECSTSTGSVAEEGWSGGRERRLVCGRRE